MNESSAYVGLDVHKDTIAVAVALPGREEPVYRGEIKNQRKSLVRLIRSLSPHGEVLSFCYEAGPCGYGPCVREERSTDISLRENPIRNSGRAEAEVLRRARRPRESSRSVPAGYHSRSASAFAELQSIAKENFAGCENKGLSFA